MNENFVFILAALAWDSLWLQFVLLPFYSRPELLHEKIVSSGSLTLSNVYLDSEGLMRPIAGLIRDVKNAGPKDWSEEELMAILNQVNYRPILSQIEAAMRDKKQLKSLFDTLVRISSWLWIICAVHLLAVVSIPLTIILKSYYNQFNRYDLVFLSEVVVSVVSVLTMIGLLVLYRNKSTGFHGLLNEHRA